MAIQRKTKGILIYNLLLKEISQINKHLPEDRKLSIKERRELISNKIYPKYKDQARSRIRLTPLRDKLLNTVRRIPKKEGCDVLAIPLDVYTDVPYYDIESLIENILPKCIYIKVDAGEFGQTSIFNTRDFSYYNTGLSDITNRINESVRNGETDRYIVYNGSINLRPGKKNDGNPINYFLEMILESSKKRKVKNPVLLIIPTVKKKTKKQARSEANVKQYVRQQEKKLKQQKSVFKRIRKEVLTAIRDIEQIRKSKFLKREAKAENTEQIYKGIIQRVKKHRTDGKLSESKYNSITKQIKAAYKKGKGKDSKK
jgi:hypothetical protein